MIEEENTRAPLASKAVGGALWLGLSQVVRLLLTTLSTIVIARLLSPDDYGVVAMAAPVIAFVAMFQDFGFSAATVQKRELCHGESNAMFWLNLLASGGIAVLLLLLSPLIGLFYGDMRAGYVTAASSLAVVVGGLALQHGALLNRDMHFAALSGADMASALVTFLVAATAAFVLHSYWALILGTIAGTVVQSLVFWRASRWRPRLPMNLSAARSVAGFGGNVTGFNLFNFLIRNSDDVLLARFTNAAQLGLYDRSYKLMMLPIQNINAPLQRLLLPLLSRHQDEPARYREIFVFTIRVVMLASAPGIAIATVLSDRLMPFLLGERWAAAGPIFFWLGMTGLIQPIANMTGVLFMSSARTRLMFKWSIWSGIITLAGFAIALTLDPTAVSVARWLFITATLRLPIVFYLAARGSPVSSFDMWKAQLAPLIGSAVAAWVALQISPSFSTGALLCIAIPMAYALAFAGTLATRDGRRAGVKLGSIVRDLVDTVARRILRRDMRLDG
jgi:PST family polysaccharide transporter